MQHSQQELEDLISQRLIKQAQTDLAKPTMQEPQNFLEREEDIARFESREAEPSVAGKSETEIVVADETGAPATSFAKVEKSLASLGFFTPSSRRLKDQKVKRISFTRELEGKRVEVTAEIIPSAIFGLPVTADQDKYLALQKIITDLLQLHGKVENPVRFKSADLLRLLNRSTKTGKNFKEVSEWLDVMSSTTIFSNGVVYVAGQKRYAKDRFRVFDRAISVGKELEDGTIAEANYVWLSNWQLDNINNNFLLPIDLETYQQLRNHIAKALVPLLQIWLFASHKAGSFEKRYDELCEILTLQTYKVPSLILRQLQPSLDELTSHGYIKKWRIEKTSDGKAYKVILFHGPKFYRDRRSRIEQKSQATKPSVLIAESEIPELSLPEPGKLSPPSTQQVVAPKKRGLDRSSRLSRDTTVVESSPDASDTDTSTETDIGPDLVDKLAVRGVMPSAAIKLLVSFSPERLDSIQDYIEYWDHLKAAGKEVGPGLLYDLMKNGDAFPNTFEPSRQAAARKAAEERKNRLVMAKQTLELSYDEYRRATLDQFIQETIPTDEFERRVGVAIQEMKTQPTFWNKALRPEITRQMAEHQVRMELAKQVSLLSFDDFCRTEAPRILSGYGIDPVELGIKPQTKAT